MRPLQWWAESAPPGGDRVKISENSVATSVAPGAPVDTSLIVNCNHTYTHQNTKKYTIYDSLQITALKLQSCVVIGLNISVRNYLQILGLIIRLFSCRKVRLAFQNLLMDVPKMIQKLLYSLHLYPSEKNTAKLQFLSSLFSALNCDLHISRYCKTLGRKKKMSLVLETYK